MHPIPRSFSPKPLSFKFLRPRNLLFYVPKSLILAVEEVKIRDVTILT